MYESNIGPLTLTVTDEAVRFGKQELRTEAVEGLQVINSDFTIYFFLIFPLRQRSRIIRLRESERSLEINFAGLADRDAAFSRAMNVVWRGIGVRLVRSALSRLSQGETITLAGINMSDQGVWVQGGWTGAPNQLVPWDDLKTYRSNGELTLSSKSNLRYRSDVPNKAENAMILDSVVQFILDRTNERKLAKP